MMPLEISPPFSPMEAVSVETIPKGEEWQYEPKWDGFRCVAFRDGDEVQLQSKAGQPLARYFPEIVEAIRGLKAGQFVLDGELAIPSGSFDDLLLRLHPAATRVRKLAAATPAIYIAFDLLADARGHSFVALPLAKRRVALEKFAARYFPEGGGTFRLSLATTDLGEAKKWLGRVGATLDGIIAKRLDLEYRSGERDGMQKIKNYRSADCVIGGFRYGTDSREVGSLLLGLYNEAGELDHVGFTSSIKKSDRPALTKKLESRIEPPGFTGRAPRGPSRWNAGKNSEWQPLRADLVVEVCYDHFTGGRFRHGTKLLRWRADKEARQCRMEQVKQEKRGDLLQLLR